MSYIDKEGAKLFQIAISAYVNRPSEELSNLMWAMFKLIDDKRDNSSLSDICKLRADIHEMFKND